MMIQKYTIKGIRKFNEDKVIEWTRKIFKALGNDLEVSEWYNTPTDMYWECITLMAENGSTQGVNVKLQIGETVVVELPWLASEMDVRLCYAFLNSIMKVHRMARIMDENEKSVKLTDCDAEEQWSLRLKNMADIIKKGERTVLAGVNRDFYLDPSSYQNDVEDADGASAAFRDFVFLQWADSDRMDVAEEKRHITDDEELSSIRVVDNSEDVFIGACQYVGMMRDNTCKMMSFETFCRLMDGESGFRRMDAAQALLDKLDEKRWCELFDKAEGVVRDNFRKTFIMRWNTCISDHKMADFEDCLENFPDEGIYYDWSIWDFKKSHVGDRFYMIRTGDGVNGVVMKGTLAGTPCEGEDWSGRGRTVYYVRMELSHLIHPDKASLVLTTDALSAAIPDFDWQEGHSGEMLSDEQANRMEQLWEGYLKRLHEQRDKEMPLVDFSKYFKEKGKCRGWTIWHG